MSSLQPPAPITAPPTDHRAEAARQRAELFAAIERAMSGAPAFTGTAKLSVYRGHDSRLKCTACGDYIDRGKGHLAFLDVRLCTDCACVVCHRANDSNSVWLRIDGHRHTVHELCRSSLLGLARREIVAEDNQKPIAELVPPGRYKLRADAHKARSVLADETPPLVLVPADTLAALIGVFGDDSDTCGLCYREFEPDEESTFVRGVPVHAD